MMKSKMKNFFLLIILNFVGILFVNGQVKQNIKNNRVPINSINDTTNTLISKCTATSTLLQNYVDPNNPKVNTSVMKDLKSQLDINFGLKNYQSIDSITLQVGLGPGLGNIKNLKFDLALVNGQYFLKGKEGNFQVPNGNASFSWILSNLYFTRDVYLTILIKKKDGTLATSFTKQVSKL